ncbi:hypothetical protein G1H11_15620 [Phytoactinopolyspora alkaliphila]|uniref:Uncharacterized protein n=1 Tax=Phytoactinopolyspora alkaliphila TaxID=1783498 RepID=A0A6N9YPG7_9ACTN|nr:hypothetical protein [Phytoactinopolyspora alkaliphila]NED96738.1 hypothetical protein [Phytoactinopolyspora alkaliphila]
MTSVVTPLDPRRDQRARSFAHRVAPAWLHARARGIPLAVLGIVAVALAAWWCADWLVHREWSTGADSRVPVVAGAPLLAVVLASAGLGGQDEELERSTAVRWRVRRLGHILGMTLLIGCALVLIGLWEPREYGAFELARNTLGFVGLVAASAPVLGSRLAWVPSFAYAAVVYLAAPKPILTEAAWWTWPLQQWGADLAVLVVVALFVGGTALYVMKGARPARDADE